MKPKGILTICAICIALFSLRCQKDVSVPNELIGVWTTTHPRYADSPFEIRKQTLILETGGGYFDIKVYPVLNVEKIPRDNRTLYIITYAIPEGVEYKFSFYYSPEDGGTIRYKNQKYLVWKKVRGSLEAEAPIGR